MIRHVVMWTMKPQAEGADGRSNALKVRELLESCRGLVPGMLEWQVVVHEPGLEATCDLMLYSVFDSAESLDAYQHHPHHVAMKPFIGAVRAELHCFDCRVG